MLILRSGSPYWLLSATLFGLTVGVAFGAMLRVIGIYWVAGAMVLVFACFVWMTLRAWKVDKENG